MISEKNLVQWNEEGLIPGPHEDEESYVKRVSYCHSLKEHIEKSLPFKPEEKASESNLLGVFQTAKSLFDIAPKWIPIYFSNYHLSLWHGGCAWIFQVDEHSSTGALLQLREPFRSASHYLKIYSRDELISHELTHVGRMTFHEPKFEEFHAYRTSTSPFRKWVGPIFRSSKETLYFLLILIAVLFANLTIAHTAVWINLLPLAFIFGLLIRLWINQRQYSKCLSRLETIFPRNSLKVIYRLTDREIEEFSRMELEEIKAYIDCETSLRWRAIVATY